SGTHDRVLIENISNADGIAGNDNNTFDIGGFGIVTSSGASTFVGQQIVIEDDGPTASQAQQTGTVDEDGVPGGIAGGVGDVAGEATQATGSVAPLFNSGADAPLTFSLNTDTSGLPALTSGGVAVTYAVAGNTLTASAGLNTVFTFALNGTTGAWTFTLADQLDHPTLNGLPGDNTENDLAINLSSILRATDADGDTVTAAANALIVTVDDDTPAIKPDIADGLVDFAAGDSVTNSLNGSVGADSPATFSITSSPATLTILDGTSSQVTLLRDLTNSDTVATYFKDVDGSGTHNAGDIDFFKLTLSGGNYTFDVLQNPPPAEVNFSFAGAPSGSNLFMTFGDPNSIQIVVIGEDPLNQSQGGNITTKDVLNISQAG
ncbi:MAG: hypothetical protein E5W83_34090, partial [Mesorhizobium sp.]